MPRKACVVAARGPALRIILVLIMGFSFALAAQYAQAAVTVTANGQTSPPPVPVLTNTVVNLSASATSCPPLNGYDGYYAYWDFGDGTASYHDLNQSPCAQPVTVSHTYSSPGTYTATFTYGRYLCFIFLGIKICLPFTIDGTGKMKQRYLP